MNDVSNVTARIAYDDLREWLARAELLGEVRSVRGASWQEDIGLAAEAILREETGPCVVFDEVPGSPKGFRVLLNMFAGVRRNMTLGFPDHLTKWELSDAYRRAYLEEQKTSQKYLKFSVRSRCIYWRSVSAIMRSSNRVG